MGNLVTIQRVIHRPDGTFGVLLFNGRPLCVTCEDPWNNNAVGDSCIPPGSYKALSHNGRLYKNVWQIMNVPGRSAILIHQGNTERDTRGCILVGMAYAMFDDKAGVMSSKATLDMLRQILPPTFNIEIKSPVS